MLELVRVTAHYGKLQALDDVCLRVERGQLVSIVGANGAGKSTLVKVVVGLIRPTSGSVLLDGENITELAAHDIVRKGIVLVPEGRRLFADMTVLENLLVASSAPQARQARQSSYEKVMEVFPPLKSKQGQFARTLSGGEQQMLAVARGLMSSPKLLILDEPSLGLAPLLVRKILSVVRQLKHHGVTVLLIEQNIKASLSMCDYGYVLENGRIVLHGPGHSLLQDQRTRRAYLGM